MSGESYEFSAPLADGVEPIGHVLSLGAGVQSSTMLLRAIHGEIGPKPMAAIFADTGWEPAGVYDWLDWLEGKATDAGIPLYRVTAGNIRDDMMDSVAGGGGRFASMPLHVRPPDGGPAATLRRQCTREYKVTPLQRKIRELGATARRPIYTWIGISLDEIQRMKPARVRYSVHRWPLIEDRMTRADCLAWMERNGYPRPPRSACIGCPFHNSEEWRKIKANPEEWADALEVDAAVRSLPRIKGTGYLHYAAIPLEEVDLTSAEERGQLSLFGNECEGMCGL